MESGKIYDLGLICGTIRTWDENILFDELDKILNIEKTNITEKKEILKRYIFQIDDLKKKSPNNSIIKINNYFDLQWVDTKATYLKRTRPRPKKIVESVREGYIQLAQICLNKKDYLKFENFLSKLKDYDSHWEYGTTLNCVNEFLDENNILLFMVLDCKEEISELRSKLVLAKKKNFNTTIELPDTMNYPDRASIYFDNVFYDYTRSLNNAYFDLSFIDTDSDEYVILVHPINKKESINTSIKAIEPKQQTATVNNLSKQ